MRYLKNKNCKTRTCLCQTAVIIRKKMLFMHIKVFCRIFEYFKPYGTTTFKLHFTSIMYSKKKKVLELPKNNLNTTYSV